MIKVIYITYYNNYYVPGSYTVFSFYIYHI